MVYGVIQGLCDKKIIYVEQIKSILSVDDRGYIDYVELNDRVWSAEAKRIISFDPETSERVFGKIYKLDNPYYEQEV